MPNSILGIIFLIAFLAPGFVMILVIRRKNPRFATGQSQIEFVLWGCITGLLAHLGLVVLFAVFGFCILIIRTLVIKGSIRVVLSLYSIKKMEEIIPKTVNTRDIKILEIAT